MEYKANSQHVKIKVKNSSNNKLHVYYLKREEFGLPAGKIEDGESAREAAARELLERTGYKVDKNDLTKLGNHKGYRVFYVSAKKVNQVAKPGERSCYDRTSIKWL